MKNQQDIKHIANLVNLSFSDSEVQKLIKDIKKVSQYLMDKLSCLDTENIEPMEHIFHTANIFRGDYSTDSLDREGLLKNAPVKENGYFAVPRIMDEN
ncbi:MAG: Asp-tRNA(Asn)/Glu-tRNA(Gln) amidotransferase subunit GatC [Clostridiaceae bacterium]|nr:Asp-tRNA(Asn)/Glu-tRNA(Gln) amidotransferase subunit GatC [Clostridiaceae bacterium]